MGDEYKPHPAPRIIIPTCDGHYIGRSIDPNTPKAFAKMNPSRDKGAASPAIFNGNVLYAQGVQEVFVTEGAFDALSIIEVGAAAIALNSTSNAEALVKRLEQRRTAATLILCLDNDDAGKKAADTLKQGLQRLNIGHITSDICNGCKDPNEALTTDRGAFIEAIERAQHMTAPRPDNTSYFIDHLMGGEIEQFREVKKTGFTNLDEKAGGLYSGLYTVAAISSLGKTTFCAQIADQLAAAGNDVVFFSLEQSRLELVSKSIARRTAQNDLDTAVTSLSIRRGYLPRQVLQAAEQYKQEVQERISIIEGNFTCNISFIGDYIKSYIKRNNTRPVVFIDYLQILQPEQNGNRQQTTKEMVDTTITTLKRLSREMGLTIFVVCSVNRANYLTPIDFESLKESGGIEYTSDVIWGLQLQCLNDPIFDKQSNIKERREKIKEAKAATPRKIELVCLKNRYGVANFSCYFNYYPANDLFTPCSDAELDFTPPASKTWGGEFKKV
jgi:replicative DNA helicase